LHGVGSMKHSWSLAALVIAGGCAADAPAQDPDDVPPDPAGGETVTGGGGTAYGCSTGARVDSELHRFASGGTIEVRIDDTGLFPQPRTIASSAPAVMTVAQTARGAVLTGVAPGTAELEVWRCDRRVASYPITVVQVADVDIRLSLGLAGRTERLTTLVGLPGSVDQLEVTYLDDQHVPLAGSGAARFAFSGGVRAAPPIEPGFYDSSDRIPRELVPIAIDGAGRIIATAGALEVAVDVTTTPAPARLELRLARLGQVTADASLFALDALGETATGQPIAGLAPAFTVAPAGVLTEVATDPPSRQLLLLGQPPASMTFTATVAGVTATLTEAFP
jgi:hypothetical protein